MAQVSDSRIVRAIYMALGLLSIGVAFVGVVVPGIPTTPLVILAAFFFARSSERFEGWLLEHRTFGPLLRDWRANRSIARRAKVVSVVAIVATFSVTLLVAFESTPVRLAFAAFGVALITFILTRPTAVRTGDADG